MQWHGRIPSKEAHRHRKEDGLSRKERACTSAMPSLEKRWKVDNMNPKAHMSFMLQELNTVKVQNITILYQSPKQYQKKKKRLKSKNQLGFQ